MEFTFSLELDANLFNAVHVLILGRIFVQMFDPELVIVGARRWHLSGELSGQLCIRDCAVRHILSPPGTVAPPPVWTATIITARTPVSTSSVVRTSAPLSRSRTVRRGPRISWSAGTDRTSSSPLRA